MIYSTGLREQTEYESLCDDNPEDHGMIDEIIETMVEMMVCTAPTQLISGKEYSSVMVKQRVMKIYRKHMVYMVECLKNNKTKISNIKAYLKATIFNAQSTIDNYYRTKINSDMNELETEDSDKYNGLTYDELESMLVCN